MGFVLNHLFKGAEILLMFC